MEGQRSWDEVWEPLPVPEELSEVFRSYLKMRYNFNIPKKGWLRFSIVEHWKEGEIEETEIKFARNRYRTWGSERGSPKEIYEAMCESGLYSRL